MKFDDEIVPSGRSCDVEATTEFNNSDNVVAARADAVTLRDKSPFTKHEEMRNALRLGKGGG